MRTRDKGKGKRERNRERERETNHEEGLAFLFERGLVLASRYSGWLSEAWMTRRGNGGENPRGGWSRSSRVFRRLNQLKRKNSRGKIFETCPARRARSLAYMRAFLLVLVRIDRGRSTRRVRPREFVRYRRIASFSRSAKLRSRCGNARARVDVCSF